MKRKVILFAGILLALFIVGGVTAYLLNQKTIYKYPTGYYCVPNKGVAYFEKDEVPSGAILIKPNPDYTNGEYTKRLNLNFFKAMGCLD
jgi:hypothetical protein